jgi:hypothetical protein
MTTVGAAGRECDSASSPTTRCCQPLPQQKARRSNTGALLDVGESSESDRIQSSVHFLLLFIMSTFGLRGGRSRPVAGAAGVGVIGTAQHPAANPEQHLR